MKPFLIFLLGFLYLTTNAQSNKSGSTHALLIGISQYKEVTPLQFADRDAVAFAEFLKTQQVPEDNIKLFLNENATRFNIVDELYNTSQQLKKGDKFFFYFGGHGDLEARIGYENSLLLLYNSFKKSYFQGNEYLQLSELKTWFGALTQKGVEVIFIADACHSGGLIGGKEGNTKTQKALQESWDGITKILSSKADEFSLEGKQWGGGRGIFSYHLVNGLTGRADANKDQKVSLAELSNYLTTNVVREANPNIQTPVILGNNKQFLSKVSKEGLAKLADYEKRNFPIITEVNIKGGEERDNLLISKLDTTLVYTYKQFTKALKAKRLNTFDDSTDYALLHYRKLVARKIPDNLVQMMKRSLGAALMERELEIMKNLREKGQINITTLRIRDSKALPYAISNLEEAKKLFGNDYIAPYLQSRIWILQSQLPPNNFPTFIHANTVDKNLQNEKEAIQKYQSSVKEMLLKGMVIEPNMISTYTLLASSYRSNKQIDSALYYQEKVVELLPNQAYVHFNLARSYSNIPYQDDLGRTAPHPKAIAYYEKTVALDSTIIEAYRNLGALYMGERISYDLEMTHPANRNYSKAIHCVEKLLAPYLSQEQQLLKNNLIKLPQDLDSESDSKNSFHNFNNLTKIWTTLHFLHKADGNETKAEEYLDKVRKKADSGEAALGYLMIVSDIYDIYEWNEDEAVFKLAFEFQEKARKKAEEYLKAAPVSEKPLLTLKYREILKSIGVTYRVSRDYNEAENYFKQAMDYAVIDSPILSKLKQGGGYSPIHKGRTVSQPNPHCIQMFENGEYVYILDANSEMFELKLEQGKMEEAFTWLEKAFQQSVKENGNDVSGQPFEDIIFEAYPNLDQARFKALKAKYFPPTEKK